MVVLVGVLGLVVVVVVTRPPSLSSQLKPAFEALDTNQDGVISRAEFRAAMDSVRDNLASVGAGSVSAADLEAAFDAADRDKTGSIDYQEFVAVMSDMTVAKLGA